MDDLEKFQTVNEEWSKMQHWEVCRKGRLWPLVKHIAGKCGGQRGALSISYPWPVLHGDEEGE